MQFMAHGVNANDFKRMKIEIVRYYDEIFRLDGSLKIITELEACPARITK